MMESKKGVAPLQGLPDLGTSGSAVGRGAVALLGSELEDRFAPNQPPAGTTILPTGIA